MNNESHDPRDIPILTDAVEQEDRAFTLVDRKALQSTMLLETLKLADSLLNAAVKEIEATLFERVLDRLRAELPELMDRVIREHGDGPRSLSE